jgi:ribosome-binding factor A
MNEGKRQKQVAGLIQEEVNVILQRMGLTFIEGSMVSVASVKITPDLLEARIYFSIFNSNNPSEENSKAVLKKLEDKHWEVKKELAARIKHQLRRMPEVKFFIDDTLDHVFKMEELFKQIKQQEEGNKSEDNSNPKA